jgi:hypothetical protein
MRATPRYLRPGFSRYRHGGRSPAHAVLLVLAAQPHPEAPGHAHHAIRSRAPAGKNASWLPAYSASAGGWRPPADVHRPAPCAIEAN